MTTETQQQDKRTRDPYLDRRSGQDRRIVHNLSYFVNGGIENRDGSDRRNGNERREGCIPVTKWSSVCVGNT